MPIRDKDFYIVGKSLAQLHRTKLPNFASTKSGFNIEIMKNKVIPKLFEDFLGLKVDSLIQKVESYQNIFRSGLCHGDLFRINSILKKEKMYFLDLETMGKDYTLLDVGKAIFGMITPRTILIDKSKLYMFLQGYTQLINLTNTELMIVPYITALAGIQVSLWRYNYWSKNPQTDITKDLWKDSLTASLNWLNFQLK